MKKFITSFIISLNVFISLALAGQLNKIELIDGSVIIGEISGVNNGKYTVNSREFGVLQIEESRIKQIVPAQTNQSSSDKIETIKNKILGDKETMSMVSSLQNDPQFQEIINDPEIISAIKSGNTASLINNEKLMRLKDNPIIRDIKDRTEKETP